MNIGADDGRIPAKVSDKVRAIVTAGLAKLVDDVNQYAPPIHSPTANGTADALPERTHPWMIRSNPMVAMTSESQSAPEERVFVDNSTAGSWNMRFARTVPMQPPITCAMTYKPASRVVTVPRSRSTSVTTGLKCAPDTAPKMRINPTSAPAVAAAFSNSWSPMSLGERRLAMIPEPTTAMISSAVPSASAVRRRARSSRS